MPDAPAAGGPAAPPAAPAAARPNWRTRAARAAQRTRALTARALRRPPARFVRATARAAADSRVLGLAAEAAFWALLALPALVFGLIGTLGHLRGIVGATTIAQSRQWLLDTAATFLTADAVDQIVAPLVDDVLRGGQGGLLSLSFLLSLLTGSSAMTVAIEALTIAYGLDGIRGFLRTRILALAVYLGCIAFAALALPLLVAGPELVLAAAPAAAPWLAPLYWPLVCALCTAALGVFYTVAVPVRTPWWKDLPGALLAMAAWIGGSAALRLYFGTALGGASRLGVLAAPIAVLLWLYVSALAVMIGAVLNAQIDRTWPDPATREARRRLQGAPGPAAPVPPPRTGPAPATPPADPPAAAGSGPPPAAAGSATVAQSAPAAPADDPPPGTGRPAPRPTDHDR
ncbi:YihY/virulence factor BrkB family protein [Allonocardiopsis opalescens]|uniref:YihY/virulence factor BrkB family protein n=1 Tax=Allonocardiopsis opalescens TaxID=1144618 RepID=UPI0011B1E99B|nr:YhjD/YihY/BrkB family envelope integrity protein [Allonocardiopsis opalescens]